jgi:hypothetical protein
LGVVVGLELHEGAVKAHLDLLHLTPHFIDLAPVVR